MDDFTITEMHYLVVSLVCGLVRFLQCGTLPMSLEVRELNIGTASYYFLIISCLFEQPEAYGWAHANWS